MSSSDDDYCSPTGRHAAADAGFSTDLSDFNIFNYAWIITAVCVVLATILTTRLIYMHCLYFHKPAQQKHIVRILLMVPIYAIDSWLSFRFYWLSVYFDLFRDCYEAIVIYEFYMLLVEYAGGYERTKDAFELKAPFKLVVPLCCWEVSPKRGMLRWLSRLTLQYVLIRPLMAVIAFLLQTAGQYCPGELTAFHAGYPWVTLVGLISVTVEMYALVLFYVVAKNELRQHNVVPKFLSVKFIIMMSFWQSVAVAGLVKINVIHDTKLWTTENISTGVQNTLICIEMLIVAIWHLAAFKHQEFSSQAPQATNVWESLLVCFRLADVLKEIYQSFFTIRRKDEPELLDDAHMEERSPAPPPTTPRTARSDKPQTLPPFASAILL